MDDIFFGGHSFCLQYFLDQSEDSSVGLSSATSCNLGQVTQTLRTWLSSASVEMIHGLSLLVC